tara:strand:+ start:107 stop:421 length:315 start_codon:yes stop_codon:yes gene_type:complete
MVINREKLIIMIEASEEKTLNEKLQANPNQRKIQLLEQILDEFYGVDRHWDKRAKFKEKPKQIKRRSEEQYDLPDFKPSKMQSGMYDNLHYDKDAVGEVCGINE